MTDRNTQIGGTHYTAMQVQPLTGGDGATDPRDVLSYDPKSGDFRWRVTMSSKAVAGTIAGWFDKDGYRVVTIKGKKIRCHRLAWWWMTGELPGDGMTLDHINRQPDDNRFSNLRLATPAQNACNRRVQSNNRTNTKGVTFYRNRWRATLYVKGEKVFCKHFSNQQDAVDAYNAAAHTFHGQFYYGGNNES